MEVEWSGKWLQRGRELLLLQWFMHYGFLMVGCMCPQIFLGEGNLYLTAWLWGWKEKWCLQFPFCNKVNHAVPYLGSFTLRSTWNEFSGWAIWSSCPAVCCGRWTTLTLNAADVVLTNGNKWPYRLWLTRRLWEQLYFPHRHLPFVTVFTTQPIRIYKF